MSHCPGTHTSSNNTSYRYIIYMPLAVSSNNVCVSTAVISLTSIDALGRRRGCGGGGGEGEGGLGGGGS